VQALYHDLLGWPADAAGLTAFTAALNAGATRDQWPPQRPVGQLLECRAMRAFDEYLFPEPARVQACVAASDLHAMHHPRERAVEVVMTFRQLLIRHGSRDGVAEQEHAQLHPFALARRVREPQRVVWSLAPLRLVVDDDEDGDHEILARARLIDISPDFGAPCRDCHSSGSGDGARKARTASD
jgi:hypothetical protein